MYIIKVKSLTTGVEFFFYGLTVEHAGLAIRRMGFENYEEDYIEYEPWSLKHRVFDIKAAVKELNDTMPCERADKLAILADFLQPVYPDVDVSDILFEKACYDE